jgi:hypothetical protein
MAQALCHMYDPKSLMDIIVLTEGILSHDILKADSKKRVRARMNQRYLEDAIVNLAMMNDVNTSTKECTGHATIRKIFKKDFMKVFIPKWDQRKDWDRLTAKAMNMYNDQMCWPWHATLFIVEKFQHPHFARGFKRLIRVYKALMKRQFHHSSADNGIDADVTPLVHDAFRHRIRELRLRRRELFPSTSQATACLCTSKPSTTNANEDPCISKPSKPPTANAHEDPCTSKPSASVKIHEQHNTPDYDCRTPDYDCKTPDYSCGSPPAIEWELHDDGIVRPKSRT